MNQKKINRRKFLVKSLECAAGLGVLMSCDKRTPVEPDVRKPSAPVGLTNDYDIENNQITDVILSWNPHNLTDVNGAKLTTVNPDMQILGYNIYRTSNQTPPDVSSAQPINGSSVITATNFTDANSIAVGDTYFYWLEAVDSDNIASPLSAPVEVQIMAPSPVYVAQNANAVTSSKGIFTLDADQVKKTVNAAVMAVAKGITQATPASVGTAYESILGGVTANSMIGIKINTLAATGLCTHVEVVAAIVDGLKTMLNSTFPARNIIVFDDRYNGGIMKQMIAAKFPLKDDPSDPNSYRVASVNYNTTLNNIPVSQAEPSSLLWAAGTHTIAGVPIRLSSIIPALDYIINVPVIKDSSEAGITFSLKNFFGAIDDPNSLHPGSCSDSVPQLFQLVLDQLAKPAGRVTSILTIGDGFLGAYDGGPAVGPASDWVPAQVIAGTDPVATDAYVLRSLINPQRVSHGKAALSFAMASSGSASHVLTAANSGLGSICPNPIQVTV